MNRYLSEHLYFYLAFVSRISGLFHFHTAAIVLYLLLFYVFAFPKEFAMKLLKRKQEKIRKSELKQKT